MESSSPGAKPRRISYLGPAGTHTEGALKLFDPSAEGVPEGSIAAVFSALISGAVDAGFLPMENMIQGPVTETLDLLLTHRDEVRIADSVVMEIRNALGILPGDPGSRPDALGITSAFSKDQALRQCQQTLQERFPGIQLVPTASTAAAVEIVKTEGLRHAAVVAPAAALRAAGFDVILEDASDVAGNKTRFALLVRGRAEEGEQLPSPAPGASFVTSLVVDPGRDRKGILFDILQVISVRHQVNLVTIHSRPDTRGGVVFHLDLAGGLHEPRIRECLDDLRRFSLASTGKTVEIIVLGTYPSVPFHRLPFRTVGIVGHEGAMGRWFTKFFGDAGLQVVGTDQRSGVPLRDLLQGSDVILLSVPMSKAQDVAAEIVPHLRPGQLVVENCSIKECVLPYLEQHAPEGVEVLGIHTMFGGSIESLQGENVIITRSSRSGPLGLAFEDLLYKHGAKLRASEKAEHDRVSAGVQSLLQLVAIAYANVLGESFGSSEAIDFMSTPNYRAVLQVLGRIAQQSDDLIFDLQTLNSQAPRTLDRLIAVLQELATDLGNRSTASLESGLAGVRSFLGVVKE